eukprot:12439221-Alexandrium_andersonii.AAC.1
MSASLVGSEMCIRDRTMGEDAFAQQLEAPRSGAPSRSVGALSPAVRRPVSYTHLTLPTICSV